MIEGTGRDGFCKKAVYNRFFVYRINARICRNPTAEGKSDIKAESKQAHLPKKHAYEPFRH